MNRSRLLFSFSLINFIAVFICIFFLNDIVVFKFNAYFQVDQLVSRWYDIILPALQLIAVIIIMTIDIREAGSIPHVYRYIVAYIAISVATFYTWIMIAIQFGNYEIGQTIKLPLTSVILIPIALFVLIYSYYQGTKPYKSFSMFGFSWVRDNPVVWQKTHYHAGRLGMISAMMLIILAIVNDIVYKSNWAYFIAFLILFMVYYFFTVIYSLAVKDRYN